MTDKQLNEVYKNIDDFEEFSRKINLRQDVSTERLKVKFTDSETIEITLSAFTENVSPDNFEKIKNELIAQWRSDKAFSEIKNNKIYDREINVRDNKTFIITDEFVEMLIYGREILSGHGWYIDQIKQIIKLFESGYTLIHNNELIRSKSEFVDKYLKQLSRFKSLESELL